MLVEISRELLLRAWQQAMRAVAANAPLPILQGVRLCARPDGLQLTASSTSLTIACELPVADQAVVVRRVGAVVLPARYGYEVLRKLDGDLLVLEQREPGLVTVSSGTARIRLCGMEASQYPGDEGAGDDDTAIVIDNLRLKSAIGEVATAASTSEQRPVLTGVSLVCEGDALRLAASDGIRLASRTLRLEGQRYARMEGIIPARHLQELSRMLPCEGATELRLSPSRIRFRMPGLQVESALIEGMFPSLDHVIPSSYASEIIVDTGRLLSAIECASVLGEGSVIRLAATDEGLTLLARTAEVGDMEQRLPVLSTEGEAFALSLNGKLLFELLRHSDSEQIRLRYAGHSRPLIIVPAPQPASLLYLITPVRTAAG